MKGSKEMIWLSRGRIYLKGGRKMTKKRLKAQVSDAGKYFIDGMIKEIPYKKWFATQTLIDDKKVEYLVCLIDYYNKMVGMPNERTEERMQTYVCLILGALNILRDVAYYDPDKYGDIDSFNDYCRSCWNTIRPIDFAEYELIRAFFEN